MKVRIRVTDPPRARLTDPDTSQEAAVEVVGLKQYWNKIIQFCKENDRDEGWTADELGEELDLGACHWKRVSECRAMGLLSWAVDDQGNKIKRPGLKPGPRMRCQAASRITDIGREMAY